MQRHFHKIGVSDVVIVGSIVFLVHLTRSFMSSVILLSAFFVCISRGLWSFVSFALSLFHLGSCFLKQVLDRLSSSVSTVPSIDDYFEHNVWNLALYMLFIEVVSGMFASYLVEIDLLAKIALSCHFAFDLLCCKEEVLASAR